MRPRRHGILVLALSMALQAICSCALPATVDGRRVLVEGRSPLHIKGINWNPIPIGGIHPDNVDFRLHVHTDAELMAQTGANVIRTYEPLTDVAVLDALWARGIQVINTIWCNGKVPGSDVAQIVDAVKWHKAILMWSVGNEWNYNHCYQRYEGMTFEQCVEKIHEMVEVVKAHDRAHPVASVYGELPPSCVLRRLSNVDVWGINYYDEASFTDLFHRWAVLSDKPMFIGEYGADAFNALTNQYDPGSQAHATAVLTQELVSHSTVTGGVCLGGIIFEFADEWWKDQSGSPHHQDIGGIAPGGGPYPDKTFNEEWWGLVAIDRIPREAFHAFANVQIPAPADCPSCANVQATSDRLHCTAAGCTSVPPRLFDIARAPGAGQPTLLAASRAPEAELVGQQLGAEVSATPR